MINFSKIIYISALVFLYIFANQKTVDCRAFTNGEIKREFSTFSKGRDEIVLFDSYFDDTAKKDKKKHLDNFASTLLERSDEIGYVISYGIKNAQTNDALKNLNFIKSYLKKKKINFANIVFKEGERRDKAMTNFYIEPSDAEAPY